MKYILCNYPIIIYYSILSFFNSIQKMQKFQHIISSLSTVALTSKMTDKLSAVIIIGKKIASVPVTNIDRGLCRGHICGNLHAECNALRCFYGSNLYYHPTKKWSLL